MIKCLDVYKLIGLLVGISLFSCRYSKEDAEKYLPGQYIYEIPSGEFQTLEINQDFTFEQIVYSKNKKDTLYVNVGKMYVDGNKIEFENWLECYEFADQKMSLKPNVGYSSGNYWRKPKGNDDVLIIKLDQTNYIFRKRSVGQN